jgi:hypothetical protein
MRFGQSLLCIFTLIAAAKTEAAPVLSTFNFVEGFSNIGPTTVSNEFVFCNSGQPCSGSATIPGSGFNLFYNVLANAGYGSLSASAQVQLNPNTAVSCCNLAEALALSESSFDDLYTFLGASRGSAGTATFSYSVSGSGTSSSGNTGMAFVQAFSNGSLVDTEAIGASGTVQLTVPIVFGQTMDLMTALEVVANDFTLQPQGASAVAAYSSAASLTGISVKDASGNPVNLSLSTSSGTIYGSNDPPATAPEPSAVVLTCVGLALCLASIKWRRKRT